jgi:hypothetical protein
MHVHFCRKMFIESLPSNERLVSLRYSGFQASCHIAPSLRLFIPNGLQAHCHFFLSKGCACNVGDWSHLPPHGSAFPWCLPSYSSRSSLLKAAHPEQFPHRMPVHPGVSPSSCFYRSVRATVARVINTSIYPWLLVCC